MFVLYFILIGLSGIPLVVFANKRSNILKEMGIFEKTALTVNIGFAFYYTLFFLLSLFKLKASQSFFIVFAVVDAISLVLIALKKFKVRIYKTSSIEKILLITFAISMLYFIVSACVTRPIFPDEYSAWATIPKLNFAEGSLFHTRDYHFVKYPPFMTSIYSGFYFFIDKINDSAVRGLQPILSLFNYLGIFGYLKRKQYNPAIYIIGTLIAFLTYTSVFDISASTYADVPFALYYTFGCLYFLDIIFEESKISNSLLAFLYLGITALVKPDGVYLLLFFIPIVLFELIFGKHSIKSAISCFAVLILSSSVYFGYEFFRTSMCAASSSSSTSPVVEYTLQMLSSLFTQFFTEETWIIVIIAFLGLLSLCIYRKCLDKRSGFLVFYMFLIVFINILFLAVCYVMKFGGEAPIAASFARYITRALFIAMISCCVMEKCIKDSFAPTDANSNNRTISAESE